MIVWALMICIATPQTEAKAALDKCKAYNLYQSRALCARSAIRIRARLMDEPSRWYSPEVTRVFCESREVRP